MGAGAPTPPPLPLLGGEGPRGGRLGGRLGRLGGRLGRLGGAPWAGLGCLGIGWAVTPIPSPPCSQRETTDSGPITADILTGDQANDSVPDGADTRQE